MVEKQTFGDGVPERKKNSIQVQYRDMNMYNCLHVKIACKDMYRVHIVHDFYISHSYAGLADHSRGFPRNVLLFL